LGTDVVLTPNPVGAMPFAGPFETAKQSPVGFVLEKCRVNLGGPNSPTNPAVGSRCKKLACQSRPVRHSLVFHAALETVDESHIGFVPQKRFGDRADRPNTHWRSTPPLISLINHSLGSFRIP
jgi:hypothetical protein